MIEEPAAEEHDRRAAEHGEEAPSAPAQDATSRHVRESDGSRAADAESSEAEPADDLDRIQQEFSQLNDRHLRLAAEFSNYRRRQELEMTEVWGRAQADIVRRLLDVLDDLQRVSALDPSDEAVSVQAIVEGVDLVERKFARALEDAGVEVIAPVGEPFDPETMEAMMRVDAESGEDDDRVAGVFQKGYRLKGHLVRPARVSVFKVE